jgi:hypothetical protein
VLLPPEKGHATDVNDTLIFAILKILLGISKLFGGRKSLARVCTGQASQCAINPIVHSQMLLFLSPTGRCYQGAVVQNLI